MKGIAKIVVVGVLVGVAWWVTRRIAEGKPIIPTATEAMSEYEKLHKVVPITKFVEKEIPVYGTIEEWEKANG